MTFISYAQNYEDVMLWRALKHVKNGFYIDVGAAWPDEHSVTKAFYLIGWTGINIEPNPKLNQLLMEQRLEDKNLAVAVSDKIGHISFNVIESTGLSTASDEIAEQHRNNSWQIQRLDVETTTLADICKRYKPLNQEIHFLKVDVEGMEESVLRGNDWEQYRPWIVVVEATLPMSPVESYKSWEAILTEAKYHFAYADGLNRFYVADEHLELLEAFRYQPNYFDNFKVISQLEAEARAEQEKNTMQDYGATLNAVYDSRSWKLTGPLRWVNGQVRRLKYEGLEKRLMAPAKKILRKINHQLLLRPKLRQRVIRCSKWLGLFERLKSIQRGLINVDPITVIETVPLDISTQRLEMDPQHISPRAQQIYSELFELVIRYQKGKS